MRRGTHFYCLEPARLLHLVVDDRLVLVDAIVASSGEDHILIKRWKKDESVIRRWLRRLPVDLQSGKKSLMATSKHWLFAASTCTYFIKLSLGGRGRECRRMAFQGWLCFMHEHLPFGGQPRDSSVEIRNRLEINYLGRMGSGSHAAQSREKPGAREVDQLVADGSSRVNWSCR